MAGAPIIYLTNALVQFRLTTEAAGSNHDYSAACTAVAVVPEQGDENEIVTLDAVRHVRYGPTAYTLQITAAQDWSATGFSRWLYENEGKDAYFSVGLNGTLMDASNPRLTGSCVLVAGQFGGEAETWIEAEIEMPCYAKPIVQTSVTQEAEIVSAPAMDVRRWGQAPEPEPAPEPGPVAA